MRVGSMMLKRRFSSMRSKHLYQTTSRGWILLKTTIYLHLFKLNRSTLDRMWDHPRPVENFYGNGTSSFYFRSLHGTSLPRPVVTDFGGSLAASQSRRVGPPT